MRVEYSGGVDWAVHDISRALTQQGLHCALNTAAPLPVEYSGSTARWQQRPIWATSSDTDTHTHTRTSPTWQTAGSISTLLWGYEPVVLVITPWTRCSIGVERSRSTARRIQRIHCALNTAVSLNGEYSDYIERWIQRLHCPSITAATLRIEYSGSTKLNTAATMRVEYSGSTWRWQQGLHCALNTAAPLPVEYSGSTARWQQRPIWATSSDERNLTHVTNRG